jgi:hypothetical protein
VEQGKQVFQLLPGCSDAFPGIVWGIEEYFRVLFFDLYWDG